MIRVSTNFLVAMSQRDENPRRICKLDVKSLESKKGEINKMRSFLSLASSGQLLLDTVVLESSAKTKDIVHSFASWASVAPRILIIRTSGGCARPHARKRMWGVGGQQGTAELGWNTTPGPPSDSRKGFTGSRDLGEFRRRDVLACVITKTTMEK